MLNAINIERIVFGYIRSNKNFVIPTEITHIILIYYFDNYKFDTNHCNENVIFSDDGNSARCKTDSWMTCILDGEISNKKCNKFDICIKWKKCISYFYIGFIIKPISSLPDIKYWVLGIGEGEQKDYSIGIFVASYNRSFYLYDKDNMYIKLNYVSYNEFKQGDTFRICFDFTMNSWTIYHNQVKADKLSLYNYKFIIPAVTMFCGDEEIEITNFVTK